MNPIQILPNYIGRIWVRRNVFIFMDGVGMSSFTRFNAALNIEYASEASMLLKDDYWVIKKEFTYFIRSEGSGLSVTVPVGFLTDGASVPPFARSLINRMGAHSQAACVHDYLCETYRIHRTHSDGRVEPLNIQRKEIDAIFYEALEVIEFPKWKTLVIRLAVDCYRLIFSPKKPSVNKDKQRLETIYKATLLN